MCAPSTATPHGLVEVGDRDEVFVHSGAVEVGARDRREERDVVGPVDVRTIDRDPARTL